MPDRPRWERFGFEKGGEDLHSQVSLNMMTGMWPATRKFSGNGSVGWGGKVHALASRGGVGLPLGSRGGGRRRRGTLADRVGNPAGLDAMDAFRLHGAAGHRRRRQRELVGKPPRAGDHRLLDGAL